MEYKVYISRKFSYTRSYKVLKSTKGNTNALSRWALKLVDRYVLKKRSDE